MSKWKIWETMKTFGSSTDDDVTPEDIRAAQAMIDEIELPDGLSEKILAAMTERRAENEANRKKKFNVQKIQGICQKPSMRVAAVAAVLALAMGFSPLRSYAAAALRNATKSTHDWTQDLSVENEEKSSHDFHASVIEHRIANDTLYLGMQIYWDGETLEKLQPSYDDRYMHFDRYQGNEFEMSIGCGTFDLFLNGEIADSEGNTLTFDTQDIADYDGGYWNIYSISQEIHALEEKADPYDVDDDAWKAYEEAVKQYEEEYYTYYCFDIHIPKLSQLIDSYDKEYTCQFTLSSNGYRFTEDDDVDEKIAFESIDFQFKIGSIDSVITTEQHAINKTYDINGTKLTLKTLTTGQTENNISFDITPSKSRAKEMKEDYNAGVDKIWMNMDICLMPNDDGPIFSHDSIGKTIMADNVDLYRFSGYALIDDPAKTTYSGVMSTEIDRTYYDTDDDTEFLGCNIITELPKNAAFKIVNISCGQSDAMFEYSLMENDAATTVYKKLKNQSIKLDGIETTKATVKAGKFSMEISADMTDSASLELENIAYQNKSVLEGIYDEFEVCGYSYIDNSVRLLDCAFVYKGNGEIRDYAAQHFWEGENPIGDINNHDIDPAILTHGAIDCDALRQYTDPMAKDVRPLVYPPYAMPKEQIISPIYIKYRVKKKDKFTDYVYYHPDYIKVDELKKQEKAHQQALDYLNSLPTFGVAD